MPANLPEATRGGAAREQAPASNGAGHAEAPEAAAPAAPASGGIKAWLPLIVTVVVMPALAYATVRFVLMPKMQQAMGTTAAVPASEGATPAPAKEDKKAASMAGKLKVTYPMEKILVNVAGTSGTRYLMTKIVLVGNTSDFKTKIDDNRDQLMDLAENTLCIKTISDLEKPTARNAMRNELINVFNNALGGPMVQEIYITEMAIQ